MGDADEEWIAGLYAIIAKREAKIADLERTAQCAEEMRDASDAKVRGLHALIRDAEAEARAAMIDGSMEALHRCVEGFIIDGADACQMFGPCPDCDK